MDKRNLDGYPVRIFESLTDLNDWLHTRITQAVATKRNGLERELAKLKDLEP